MGTRNKQKQPKSSATKLTQAEAVEAAIVEKAQADHAALFETAPALTGSEVARIDAARPRPEIIREVVHERVFVVTPNPIVQWWRVRQAKKKFAKSLMANTDGFNPGWRRRCLNMVRQWEGPGHPFPFEPIPNTDLIGRTPYYRKGITDHALPTRSQRFARVLRRIAAWVAG